jgi:phage terminase large subunit
VHDKVIPNFPHTLIKSTYLDNPQLPDNERQNILLKKDKPGFEMWWQVYGLGELGRLEGAIFQNWKYGEFNTSLPHTYGMDFGFNDPDTLVRVAIDEKNKIIYAKELIYKNGNSSEQLLQLMMPHVKRNELVVADCADKRMISELRRYFNMRSVNKSRFPVADALKMMQSYQIIITEDSKNLAKELDNYIWNDQKAGVPIAAYDHIIDAVRYAFVEHKRSSMFMGLRRLN